MVFWRTLAATTAATNAVDAAIDADATALSTANGSHGIGSAGVEYGIHPDAELEHAVPIDSGPASNATDAWVTDDTDGRFSTAARTSHSVDGTSTNGTSEWIPTASRRFQIAR